MHTLSIGRIPAIVGAVGAAEALASHIRGLTEAPKAAILFDPGLEASGAIARILDAAAKDGLEVAPFVLPPG